MKTFETTVVILDENDIDPDIKEKLKRGEYLPREVELGHVKDKKLIRDNTVVIFAYKSFERKLLKSRW